MADDQQNQRLNATLTKRLIANVNLTELRIVVRLRKTCFILSSYSTSWGGSQETPRPVLKRVLHCLSLSSLISHNRGWSCLLRDFGVCGVEMINYNFTYCSHWQGGDGGENRVGDVRPCLITCLQMVSGLCQCKDYRDKEQLTLLSPPDRVDSWVGLIGTADKRIPIQIYTKYTALQYTFTSVTFFRSLLSKFNVLNMLKCLYLLCIACDFKTYLTRPTIEKLI